MEPVSETVVSAKLSIWTKDKLTVSDPLLLIDSAKWSVSSSSIVDLGFEWQEEVWIEEVLLSLLAS